MLCPWERDRVVLGWGGGDFLFCFLGVWFWRLVMGEEKVKATHARYACER